MGEYWGWKKHEYREKRWYYAEGFRHLKMKTWMFFSLVQWWIVECGCLNSVFKSLVERWSSLFQSSRETSLCPLLNPRELLSLPAFPFSRSITALRKHGKSDSSAKPHIQQTGIFWGKNETNLSPNLLWLRTCWDSCTNHQNPAPC